jgi:hypothetical protein
MSAGQVGDRKAELIAIGNILVVCGFEKQLRCAEFLFTRQPEAFFGQCGSFSARPVEYARIDSTKMHRNQQAHAEHDETENRAYQKAKPALHFTLDY